MHENERNTASRDARLRLVVVHAAFGSEHVIALHTREEEAEVRALLEHPERAKIKRDAQENSQHQHSKHKTPQRSHLVNATPRFRMSLGFNVQARGSQCESTKVQEQLAVRLAELFGEDSVRNVEAAAVELVRPRVVADGQ